MAKGSTANPPTHKKKGKGKGKRPGVVTPPKNKKVMASRPPIVVRHGTVGPLPRIVFDHVKPLSLERLLADAAE